MSTYNEGDVYIRAYALSQMYQGYSAEEALEGARKAWAARQAHIKQIDTLLKGGK